MRANYLVCYDVADKRRLGRVYCHMKGCGLHLQFSVFLCSLTWPEFRELKTGLAKLIDEANDDVRIYPLPKDGAIVALGRGDRVPEGVSFYLN